MKKKISMLLATSMAAAALSGVLAAEITYDTGITVTVDGNAVEFDQQPVIADDRTLVPVRAIFEALGAEVEWIGETRTVVSAKGEETCELVIDSTEMKVGEETVTLDVPAMIINDRTLVPVRAISEAYGCAVEWIADTKTVVITSDATAETLLPEATPEPTATPAPTATPTPEPLTSAFADKSICLYGDDTVPNAKTWVSAVKLALAPKAFTSANGGRRPMIISTGVDLAASDCIKKIPEDTDYVLVQAGLAEWSWNWNLENVSNSQNSLEEGLDNIYFNLKIHVPDAEIIFVTLPYMTIRSEHVDANGIYNKKEMSPAEMADMTKRFAESVDCEVIDLYSECGWNADNYKDYMKNTSDSYIYPNEEGSKVISEIVIRRLMEINPEETADE